MENQFKAAPRLWYDKDKAKIRAETAPIVNSHVGNKAKAS